MNKVNWFGNILFCCYFGNGHPQFAHFHLAKRSNSSELKNIVTVPFQFARGILWRTQPVDWIRAITNVTPPSLYNTHLVLLNNSLYRQPTIGKTNKQAEKAFGTVACLFRHSASLPPPPSVHVTSSAFRGRIWNTLLTTNSWDPPPPPYICWRDNKYELSVSSIIHLETFTNATECYVGFNF